MSTTVISTPEREINGNPLTVSKWNAVHNPIKFDLRREDMTADFLTIIVVGLALEVTITSGLLGNDSDTFEVGDLVYLNLGNSIDESLEVVTVTNPNILIFNNPGASSYIGSGYINDLGRKNFIIETSIYDKSSGSNVLVEKSINRPSDSGNVQVDVSAFLKSLVGYEDTYDYALVNDKDLTLSGIFNIEYREIWQGNNSEPTTVHGVDYYFTNSAKQLGDLYGSNMGEYVPFDNVFTPDATKFMTNFQRPTVFRGFPMALTFIQGDELTSPSSSVDIRYIDINGNVLSSINTLVASNTRPFVNRLTIVDPVTNTDTVDYHFTTGNNPHFVFFKLDVIDPCINDPIYLTWLNSVGGYDYWLFFNSNSKKTATSIDSEYSRNVVDLETDTGNIDITGKSIKDRIDFGALVPANKMDGITSLFESPKVMLLTNPDDWISDGAKWQRVIINTGSLLVSETKKELINVKMSMKLHTRFTQKE